MKSRVTYNLNSNTVFLMDFKKPIFNKNIKFDPEKDNSINISSNLLLSQIIELYCGESRGVLAIEKNAYGKPYLTNRENIWFNLSHSGSAMALLLSCAGDVGVDIECRTAQKDYAKIAHRFFHAEEKSSLSQLAPHSAQRRSHMLWCLKEAYIKAIGKGLAQPLNSFRFEISRHHVDLYEPEQLHISQRWRCQYHELDNHYGLSVCIPQGTSIDYFCLNNNEKITPNTIYY
ncbi:4'-phosphopantetheinyl transferase [Xenorhabdus vietnamensis]|uniref:4'-phosphopantetheinyl transferase n=1 Tax=Xenorhabdus vietnamensis TaxID=351656 RepID=A0A1Y2S7A6_9GAMM|nr:4'-phosphopantetheinyl transferase superfamily protein [Xenorhabdus vietnamensis]OTA14544.1 4'-phosphopantetheinyl transferase [Xenorhabdus vietnamensis]